MKTSDPQAVILAAGTGSRLGCANDGRPKCLLDVGGRSLLKHHLVALNEIGLERILIVAGHGAEQVRAATGEQAEVQINEIYDQTNSLYSLWLARTWITGSVLVLNGDVLAAPQIYRTMLEAEGNALAFDSASGKEEEEMKVHFVGDRLHAINKEMEPDLSHGENLGMLKFDASGVSVLLEAADRIVREGRLKEWAPAAVEKIAKELTIKGIDVRGVPWTEIDFPEDLERARTQIWPAIDCRSVASNAARPPAQNGMPRSLIPKLAS